MKIKSFAYLGYYAYLVPDQVNEEKYLMYITDLEGNILDTIPANKEVQNSFEVERVFSFEAKKYIGDVYIKNGERLPGVCKHYRDACLMDNMWEVRSDGLTREG